MSSDSKNEIDLVPGPISQVLQGKNALAIGEEWMEVFGKDSSEVDTKSYKWHVFSFGTYESLGFDEAMEQYEKHEAPECYVMDNDTGTIYVTPNRPASCELFDFYVFPTNLAWTMAFTHEEGLCGRI